MKVKPDRRAAELGRYILENRSTVRATAKKFGISKSTVHKDVSERLKTEDPELYSKVKDILEINKQERHIRGGLATKRKYEERKGGRSGDSPLPPFYYLPKGNSTVNTVPLPGELSTRTEPP